MCDNSEPTKVKKPKPLTKDQIWRLVVARGRAKAASELSHDYDGNGCSACDAAAETERLSLLVEDALAAYVKRLDARKR